MTDIDYDNWLHSPYTDADDCECECDECGEGECDNCTEGSHSIPEEPEREHGEQGYTL